MDFVKLEAIQYGWSGDQKYHAWGSDGKEYFLRVVSPAKWGRIQQAVQHQTEVWKLGLPVSAPGGVQHKEDGIYVWEEWLKGSLMKDILPTLPREEQRRLGWDAGRILQQIHSFPAPANAEDWEQRFNSKIDRKIKLYQECPCHYENGQMLLQFLEEHRGLLHGRPQCLQHGDYHVGNMMLCNGKLYVIDFDRPDAGDPWEEFNRIVWCAQISPAFASGMVDGYFDGQPPLDFWNLLALYIACNTISSLPWAVPFGEGEISTMKQQATEILEWYSNMTQVIPSWYKSSKTGKTPA